LLIIIKINIHIYYFQDSIFHYKYKFDKELKNNENTFKILFMNKVLINDFVNKIFIVHKNFDKTDFINLNKYNKRFIIHYILNLFSFLNGFFSLLFAISNKSF
jgi:hypothetical protein